MKRQTNYLRPMAGKVLFRADANTDRVGAIIIPEKYQEKSITGIIVAVGDGLLGKDGARKPLEVCVGDRVVASKYGGTEINLNGVDYKVLNIDDIYAVIA